MSTNPDDETAKEAMAKFYRAARRERAYFRLLAENESRRREAAMRNRRRLVRKEHNAQ